MSKGFNSAIIGFGLVIAAHALPSYAAGNSLASARLQIMWSIPVEAFPGPPAQVGQTLVPTLYKGFFLYKASMFSNGHINLLGDMLNLKSQSLVLIKNIDEPSPQIIELPIKEAQPDLSQQPSWFDVWFEKHIFTSNQPSNIPSVFDFSGDDSQNIWLGGDTHAYMDIASANHSDDYIEKLDSSDRSIWARSYTLGSNVSVVAMIPTSAGLGVLSEGDEPGFASLSLLNPTSGDIAWTYNFGNGKGASLAKGKDNSFVIATFSDDGSGSTYQDNVSVLSLSNSGHLQHQNVIRKNFNQESGAYYGNVQMSVSGDGVYVLSRWDKNLQPSELTKLSARGKVLWTKEIPNSFESGSPFPDETVYCTGSAISTLPNGDAFVACALSRQIYFHEFDQNNGSDLETSFPIPPCNKGKLLQSLSLFPREDGNILVVGSGPGPYSSSSGCTWLGRFVPKA